jgi:hypothetical protein
MHITRFSLLGLAAAAVYSAGCAASRQGMTTVESTGEVATSSAIVTPANNRSLPMGARLNATLDQAIGTKISKTGDMFTATVSQTLYASDGSIVIPAGAKIEGRVTALDDSDHAGDPALIRLAFDRLRFNGQSYPLAAAIAQSNPVETTNSTGVDKTKQIVIGGAVGAALGGLLSKGDLDKIVIGGALGAAAGSVVSLGTEMNATLPAGSQMTLHVTQTTMLR